MLRVMEINKETIREGLNAHNRMVDYFWGYPMTIWCDCTECVDSLEMNGMPANGHTGADLQTVLQELEIKYRGW